MVRSILVYRTALSRRLLLIGYILLLHKRWIINWEALHSDQLEQVCSNIVPKLLFSNLLQVKPSPSKPSAFNLVVSFWCWVVTRHLTSKLWVVFSLASVKSVHGDALTSLTDWKSTVFPLFPSKCKAFSKVLLPWLKTQILKLSSSARR